ncbi:MAG: cobalamin-independent methionine synthase II family protein, partial [Chloroflexi bacterium]|nr:cobalamin-independent methionine synthase II family protein [Chloroflexota bacterium]
MATTYRADHIGSLLRPAEVLQARADNAQGRITLEQLREVEDKAILDALEMQRQAGIDILSDGEFRRSWFSGGIAEAVEGVIDDPDAAYTSRWQGENQQLADATAEGIGFGEQVVGAKLRQVRRLTAHESGFLKQHASGPFKITMPGAAQRAAGWYKPGLTDRFYASRAELVQDLVEILQREVKALLDEGVLYIQLDSLRYVTALANPRQRQQMIDRGEDPDKELDEIIAADNATFQDAKRPGVTLALHMCRGNNRSAWLTEGGYDAIAEKAFGSLQVDRFLLEYDTDRAGGFEPLRFVPRDKTVVLGLISSKEPTLESQDMLRR